MNTHLTPEGLVERTAASEDLLDAASLIGDVVEAVESGSASPELPELRAVLVQVVALLDATAEKLVTDPGGSTARHIEGVQLRSIIQRLYPDQD